MLQELQELSPTVWIILAAISTFFGYWFGNCFRERGQQDEN